MGLKNKVKKVIAGFSNRAFKIVTFVSFVLLLVTMGLSLATRWVSSWDHRVSLTEHFHVSIWEGFSGDMLGALVFFNKAQHGPYTGIIVAIADDKAPPSIRRVWSAFGYNFDKQTTFKRNGNVEMISFDDDLPGIHFRHFGGPTNPSHFGL